MAKFQASVLGLVSKVPRSKVTTYKELARALGRPHAWRAVANALARNPHPIKIPCHRVVRSDGKIGGYKLGTKQKVKLLAAENIEVQNGKILISKYLFQF